MFTQTLEQTNNSNYISLTNLLCQLSLTAALLTRYEVIRANPAATTFLVRHVFPL